MKKTNTTNIDNRSVAIYARKSKVTNKGDSIGTQKTQSEDYARSQLHLPPDYVFSHYEDLGLSGYYADRPAFQQMIHDIEQGKIRAVACYKLDRISRRISDISSLLNYFEKHNVALLICSNGINTQDCTSKLIIHVLSMISEFERDLITERLQDNLMELSKDGRWMGGTTPLGFTKKRISYGAGKTKTSFCQLETLPEEKIVVQNIFEAFLRLRSYHAVMTLMNKSHKTRKGKEFTILAVRDILHNPVYCIADKRAYDYFMDLNGKLYGDKDNFDGQHGIAVYNKTKQGKVEDDDSNVFSPKFSHQTQKKPIDEWIISVGRHEGFIPSEQWIEAQKLMEKIADKHNRPHRKTNALLSGIIYCPYCGKRLVVLPESGRLTNGKPRFKYACPNARKKECHFRAIPGVEMDEFVTERLADLSNEESEYYTALLQEKIDDLIKTDKSNVEIQQLKKSIEKLHEDIKQQVRNMRDAKSSLKQYIQEDIDTLSEEIERKKKDLQKLEDASSDEKKQIREFEHIQQLITSFREFAESSTREELISLIQTVVERIYITQDGEKRTCHLFIKGNSTEDYSEFFADIANGCVNSRRRLRLDTVCDLDMDCELYPHLCRGPAAAGLRPAHAGPGSPRAHRRRQAHPGL